MPYTVTRNAAGANPALTATRTYEATRDVLRTIENKAGATTLSSFTYTVNAIGQRESVATAGTAFAGVQADWAWKYDALGQIIAADHANTPAADRAYQFDSIGNRVKTASGTLTLPGPANWVSNALNQYTTVNGVVQPTTPAPAPFDADGNMTAGPVPGTNGNNPGAGAPANATDIKWDAENRLISINIGSATIGYDYDHLSRLITRATNSIVNRRYHYDGWNRIVELTNSSLQDTFTWGLDASGSLQGAGGVGGLLATRLVSSSNTDYFPTYDGNGNVSEYLGITGNNVSHYEYDPFGTLTRRTGSTSIQFQYRFSTKPRDFNTGLYYYGYRWYDPVTGRWLSRDPIEERGGVNLYGFVGNDSPNTADLLGLRYWPLCCTDIEQGCELLGYPDFDSCMQDLADPGMALTVLARGISIIGALTSASNAPPWLAVLNSGKPKVGKPLTVAGIVATGGAIIAIQIVRLNAADICGRAFCMKSEPAKQSCIKTGWLFNLWESSCDNKGRC